MGSRTGEGETMNPNQPQFLPNDMDAEQSVLGAIFADPTILPAARAKLSVDDFFFNDHREIWKAFVALEDQRVPISLATVTHKLGTEARSETTNYIAALFAMPSTLDHFAGIVLRKSQQRRLVAVGREIMVRAQADEEPETIVGGVETFVRGFSTHASSLAVPAEKAAAKVIAMIENLQISADATSDFVTGFPVLDETLWLKPTDLNVIGGRPTAGKSFLMVSLARTIAEQGKGVLYVSVEMPAEDMIMRGARSYSVIDDEVFRKKTDPERAGRAIDATRLFGSLPVWFTICSDLAVILRMAREMARTGQIKALMVDFLQKLKLGNDSWRSLDEALGRATSDMKQFSLEQGVPTFLVSSLSRPVKDKEKARPSMSSLRSSGNIESDADNIILLHRTSGDGVEFLFEKGRAKKDRRIVPMIRDFARGGFKEPPPKPAKEAAGRADEPDGGRADDDDEPDDQRTWGGGS